MIIQMEDEDWAEQIADSMGRKGDYFVFGSNRAGIHGAGAAFFAKTHYGAKQGVGEGFSGQTYAIPTKDEYFNVLSLDEIAQHVTKFFDAVRAKDIEVDGSDTPHYTFYYVTRIGCGLAGYTDEQIAPMFAYPHRPTNVFICRRWKKLLGEHVEFNTYREQKAHWAEWNAKQS